MQKSIYFLAILLMCGCHKQKLAKQPAPPRAQLARDCHGESGERCVEQKTNTPPY